MTGFKTEFVRGHTHDSIHESEHYSINYGIRDGIHDIQTTEFLYSHLSYLSKT